MEQPVVYYRNKLLKMKNEILQSLTSAKENARPPELDQTAVGRLSRIDSLQQQQMAMSSQRRCEIMLQRIEAALSRIERGDYGYCVKCDEPIAEKRLELDPTTPSCIKCAGGDE